MMKKSGALDGIRTHDLILTKNALCRLSYEGTQGLWPYEKTGGDEGARTPNPRLAKAVLSH